MSRLLPGTLLLAASALVLPTQAAPIQTLGKGGNTGVAVLPYNFAELAATLNQVIPYNWSTLLTRRVAEIHRHADLAGIERGGYRLIFVDHPSLTEETFSDLNSARYAG